MEFYLPSRFDDEYLDIIKQLQLLGELHDLVLDFTKVNYVFPFSTLAIAIAIKELIEKRQKRGLNTTARGLGIDYGAVSYLKYFGFFRAIGFPIGNAPNEASGGDRYLPITIITRKEIEIISEGKALQNGIDRHSDRLAKVIFPYDQNSGSARMLSYCLREIIRNSFEHAKVNECFVMAQRWYDGTAEITIADRGIGIYDSLRHTHNAASAEEAIKLALLPGVTSSNGLNTGSEWDNTGFGLYVISELGKLYGDFTVLSSNMLLKQQEQFYVVSKVPLSGTIVKLKISTQDSDYFPNILNDIVSKGEQIAGNLVGVVKSASKMSKSLSI
jgi:hypothetical protein